MNGGSNHQCSPGANHALSKSDFIAAWRHVVGIFNQVGATNVAWIWNLNTFPRPPANWGIDTDLAGYYPGDEFVTWVGFDHYDFGDPTNPDTDPRTPATWLDPHYQFALLHRKPIFVAEWGVRHNGSVLTAAQQNQWLNAMFDYFDSHAQIKAIAYFNYSMINDATWNNPPCPGGLAYLFGGLVNYCPNRNDLDHRLLADSGAGFRATFSARIASSRYSSQLRQ